MEIAVHGGGGGDGGGDRGHGLRGLGMVSKGRKGQRNGLRDPATSCRSIGHS